MFCHIGSLSWGLLHTLQARSEFAMFFKSSPCMKHDTPPQLKTKGVFRDRTTWQAYLHPLIRRPPARSDATFEAQVAGVNIRIFHHSLSLPSHPLQYHKSTDWSTLHLSLLSRLWNPRLELEHGPQSLCRRISGSICHRGPNGTTQQYVCLGFNKVCL